VTRAVTDPAGASSLQPQPCSLFKSETRAVLATLGEGGAGVVPPRTGFGLAVEGAPYLSALGGEVNRCLPARIAVAATAVAKAAVA
jgi:hypothetical protein